MNTVLDEIIYSQLLEVQDEELPPLSPSRGGMSIDERSLRMGDIIVSTTRKLTSRMIRGIDNAVVSHALIYIGLGGYNYNDQIVEAVPETGVSLNQINTVVNQSSLSVALRHPEITDNKALIIRDFLGNQLGKKYNFIGVVRLGLFKDKRGGNSLVLFNYGRDGESFFCSQLVLEAYKAAGLRLTKTDPKWNSPQDVANLTLKERLIYVGHLKA